MNRNRHLLILEKNHIPKLGAVAARQIFTLLVILIVLGGCLCFQGVQAAPGINKGLSYFGVLKSSGGVSVTDGSYDMVFKIYNAEGTTLWTGTYTAQNSNPVSVMGGNFEVMLGSGDGNDLNIDFTQDEYYLGITVGQDSEMTPRQRLGASPYAFNADSVDGTSIYKVNRNPNNAQKGSVGDIALDIANTKLYVKITGTNTTTGWAEPIRVSDTDEFSLRSLSDIKITNLASNDILAYNGLGKWVNKTTGNITTLTSGVTISGGSRAALGSGVTISIANSDGTHTGLLSAADYKLFTGKENTLSFSGPLARSIDAISLNQASGTADGYLSLGDWSAFSGKENALTFSGPLARSANAISLSQASGSISGYLSSTDWSTFNAKENALTFSGPLARSANAISLNQASGSTDGYLSTGDWTAFNGKVSSQWTTAGSEIYYAGNIGVGITDPAARLHLGAGSATAGTAPLKIDAGVLLAAVETGAIEFDGNGLYYTDNGATRQRHLLARDEIYFNTPITSSTVTYQHPRDPAELNGNASYTFGGYSVYGMYEQMQARTEVSSVKADVWCTNTARDITFKIFARSDATAFNPDSVTPLYSGTIGHASMPHASVSGGSLFTLTSPVTVAAGQYLFVIWESTTGGEINVTYFNADSGSSPNRHSFVIGATNANFFLTSTDTSTKYFGAAFRVYGSTDITRTSAAGLDAEALLNPGFETAGPGGSNIWANWEELVLNGGTIVDETSLIHTGSHAAKLTSSGVNWYSPQVGYTMAVTAGAEYQLSFWTRGDGVYAGKYAILDLTHTTYLGGTTNGLTTGVTGTTYTQVTTTFTAPAGCTSVLIYLLADNAAAGRVSYFDDVSVKKVTSIDTLTPLSIQTLFNNLPSAAITFSDPDGIMTSTNVRDAIIEAYNHAANATLVSPRIVLPDTLYGVVGDKLQLFVRGMIEAQDPYSMPYVINSTIGSSYPRYYEHTPVIGDVGTKSFTVKVLNYDYSLLTTKTIDLKVINPTGQPAANKNILCVGDSLTAGGVWPAELYRRLTQSGGSPAGLGYGNITFIGDNDLPGYPTQSYVGWGGWTFADYNGTSSTTSGHVLTGIFDKDKTDVGSTWSDGSNTWTIEYATGGLKVHGTGTLAASGTLTHVSGATHTGNIVYTNRTNEPQSPFWDSGNSELSFSSWASRNSYPTIDAVYVLLGWNSTAGSNASVSDYASYLAHVRTFLDQVHSDFPSAVVRVVGVQVPSVNGGLGANYGANGGLSEYYGTLRSINSMNTAYQNLANEAAYSSWVEFISTAPQFDSENNMPQGDTAVNSRNATTEKRGTNGVHPDTSGYLQIADAVYREFVNTFTSN